jgi:hypothetical protein
VVFPALAFRFFFGGFGIGPTFRRSVTASSNFNGCRLIGFTAQAHVFVEKGLSGTK